MFRKPIDILFVGDLTTDAFIRLKDAELHCKLNHDDCELCMKYGAKIPFEYVKVIKATGNAANAATAAARLGLSSALLSDAGDDQNGHECLAELGREKIITTFVAVHPHKPTNYHFVLWYESDRTILVNHIEYNRRFPTAKLHPTPRWIYLTSLSANTSPYHTDIADYLDAHPEVKLAFQPGTFQLGLGFRQLKRLYDRADVLIVNKDEAASLVSPAKSAASGDVKPLLKGILDHGPKLALVTDSGDGAYMFDGDHYYRMPIYPDPRPPFERTGCGDAFASTFVSALALGQSPLEALTWAPVNPMSVAQFVGAREGLMTLDQLHWWLGRAPVDYRPREI